jgi:VanZ family protein
MRYRPFWLGIGWAMIALILWLSLTPSPPKPISFEHADKLEHLFAYLILMGWFCQIYHGRRQRLYLMLAFIALGGAIELLQGWGGIRSAEWSDLIADGTGVLIGWLLSHSKLQTLLTHIDSRLAASS